MRRVAFFVNPLLAAFSDRRARVEDCAQILRKRGCSVKWRDTLPGAAAALQAQEAVGTGFDTVFVCGGDGTIFHILQGIAGSETALGVIPLGTGNVLAQNLGLPRDPVAAMLAQQNARTVSVPLGEVACSSPDGREQTWCFIFAAGMGMHAALMNLDRSGVGKRRWGRAAYYGGALRLLATRAVQPFQVEVTQADGQVRHFRAAELLAVRVPSINRWHAGGNLLSTHLRIASVAETGRGGLAHACFQAFARKSDRKLDRSRLGLPYPRYEEAIQAACAPLPDLAYRTPLLVEADGEVIGSGRATLGSSDKRLKLLWPEVRR